MTAQNDYQMKTYMATYIAQLSLSYITTSFSHVATSILGQECAWCLYLYRGVVVACVVGACVATTFTCILDCPPVL